MGDPGRDSSRLLDQPVDAEVDEEFAFHVEMRTRELMRQGLDPEAARTEALRGFGRMDDVKAECRRLGRQRRRRMRWTTWWGGALQDGRVTVRQMMRRPGLAVAVILTLALGIGATSAVFTVVSGVLLTPLPFPRPDRLVEIRTRYLPPSGFDIPRFPISTAELFDYRDASTSFEGVGIYTLGVRTVTEGAADPERIRTVFLDRATLEVLGVAPHLGRWFTREEDVPGASVGLLGYDLWTSRFGSDSSVVGTTVQLGGEAFLITGVMPSSFTFPDRRYQIFENIGIDPDDLGNRAAHGSVGLGRLRDGVEMDRVEAEAAGIHSGWEELYAHNVAHFPIFERLEDNIIGTDVRQALTVLLAAVLVVLLIATANVANLLLARGESRQTEVAIRGSIGASRGRLVRQFLTESVVLGAFGGALGVAVGSVALRALLRIDPTALPRPEEIALDGRVLALTGLATLGSALLFGLAPALQTARDPARGLAATRVTASRSPQRVRRGLVGVEVGLSLLVVVAAGLLIRSFDTLLSVDAGVEMGGAVTLPVVLGSNDYPDPAALPVVHEELRERLESIPGVRSASAVAHLPLSGALSRNDFRIEGQEVPTGSQAAWSAQWTAVLPNYFQTVGLPLVRGRALAHADRGGQELVVVVSQSLVERYFEGRDPLGERIGLARDSVTWARVVGVVPDTRTTALDAEAIPQVYMTLSQSTEIAWPFRVMHVMAESSVPPEQVIPAVRSAVRAVDPRLPVSRVRSLEQVRDASVSHIKLLRNLLGIFGLIALTLAAVGIHGVVSYSVARRTREIGIRLALGAPKGGVARLMLREGATPALVGVMVALPLALATSGILTGILFRTSPRDPLVFGMVSVCLLGLALLSSWIPARRALRMAPSDALRRE